MERDDGGPAFPVPASVENIDEISILHQPDPGMTLRDYFAAAALPTTQEVYPEWQIKGWFPTRATVTREEIRAHAAYRLADAMLAARRKDPGA